MLASMTGHGESRLEESGIAVHAEIRTVNNRFLKINTRLSESISRLDAAIEKQVRSHLRRGTVQLTVQVRVPVEEAGIKINQALLAACLQQSHAAAIQAGFEDRSIHFGDFLALPGMIEQSAGEDLSRQLEALTLATVQQALEQLNQMRLAEGTSMLEELLQSLKELSVLAAAIETRVPQVLQNYQNRLRQRVVAALAEVEKPVSDVDLIREIQLFSDRCDIREEIVRLQSHFQQFALICEQKESQGRKLDFLVQEIYRETNTIGSKANDSQIAQTVVEMKTRIEQMREIIQNVE